MSINRYTNKGRIRPSVDPRWVYLTPEASALVNASPDLLAAAEAVLASLGWEEKRSGTTYAGSDKLRTAIAAAKGEE